MRFGKLFVCMVTAVLLLLAVFAGSRETAPDDFLSVEITIGDKTETIHCHRQSGSHYYFFLPSYADLSQLRLRTSEKDTYTINGLLVEDGMTCEAMVLDETYELLEKGELLGSLTFVRSGSVGAMFVDTASGNMNHIHEEKGNEETGKLRLYTQEGALNHAGNILAINGRGNSTWRDEKKSYSVELQSEADLLEMGSAEKWILLSNAFDASNLRNKVVYDFAEAFGLAYSPDCDWVDLYLNGEYAGLYLLCERNEVHAERVNISKQGSFLISRDLASRLAEQGKDYFETREDTPIRVYYADMERVTLYTMLQAVENAILAEDGVDPDTGKNWQELIDTDSWAKKYLIDEVFGNNDGTALSQFYYYDGGDGTGKLFAGPVWDYDLSMGIDSVYPERSIVRFYANVPEVSGAGWPNALYRKPQYYDRVVSLYESRFRPLLADWVDTIIPQYSQRVANASRMNGLRWGYPDVDHFTDEILQFLEQRIAFLDTVWLEEAEYCYVNTSDLEGRKEYYAVKKGSLLPPWLEHISDDGNYEYQWYDRKTGETFALNQPVHEDVSLKLRYVETVVETQPEETQEETPAQEAPTAEEAVPEETEPWETEGQEPDVEPISLSRLAPMLLFVGMLVLICLAGLYQALRDRKR